MRNVGLLYLEQIGNFENDCKTSTDVCSQSLERWENSFEPLEDRISITLSESGRPPGDKLYFELLKHTKAAGLLFLRSENSYNVRTKKNENEGILAGLTDPSAAELAERSKNVEEWSDTYSLCRTCAHDDALEGIYRDDSGCRLKLDHQVKAEIDAENEKIWAAQGIVVRPQQTSTSSEKAVTRREAEARSWRTQTYCEKNGFVWKNDACHAQK